MEQKIVLNNGESMPIIGLGTWKSKPDEVKEAVHYAISHGYRHIDCAEMYGNEKEVGDALRKLFDEKIVQREEIFVTTKLFNNYHGKDRVWKSVDKSLKDLGLEYVDLLLMHWPIKFESEELRQPARKKNGFPMPHVVAFFEYLETWEAMEEIVKSGKAKSIGVSNFTIDQLTDLLNHCKIPPVTNQIEFHPRLIQTDLINYCKSKNIVITAYSPLGSTDSYNGSLATAPSLLKNEIIGNIAKAKNKTAAQILIRWSVQHGNSVLPKSKTPSRIDENLDVFNFTLSNEDMKSIDGLNINHRFGIGWMRGHFLPENEPPCPD